jgi:hypothetical protein
MGADVSVHDQGVKGLSNSVAVASGGFESFDGRSRTVRSATGPPRSAHTYATATTSISYSGSDLRSATFFPDLTPATTAATKGTPGTFAATGATIVHKHLHVKFRPATGEKHMAHDGDQDYVTLGFEDAAAVAAIVRTTGVNKDRVLGLLVRKGIGHPPSGAWERRVYRVIDEAAQQLRDEDDEELSA